MASPMSTTKVTLYSESEETFNPRGMLETVFGSPGHLRVPTPRPSSLTTGGSEKQRGHQTTGIGERPRYSQYSQLLPDGNSHLVPHLRFAQAMRESLLKNLAQSAFSESWSRKKFLPAKAETEAFYSPPLPLILTEVVNEGRDDGE